MFTHEPKCSQQQPVQPMIIIIPHYWLHVAQWLHLKYWKPLSLLCDGEVDVGVIGKAGASSFTTHVKRTLQVYGASGPGATWED